jgi:branched-chain amino acid transport system ATP-binding protein
VVGEPAEPGEPLLRLEGVRKYFGGIHAVDGVSMELATGELVGLIGPNGSGKSTLFNVISGVYRPDAGTISLGGTRIDGLDPWQVFARGIVRSFQNPRLFQGMTVLENALVPARDQKGERVVHAPFRRRWEDQEIALAKDALRVLRRNQLNEVRSHWATDVSGGQMKLLEVSRTMMADPKLLLLDEPTAGVAPKLAQEIFDEIATLRRERGLTFLIIEHRLEVLLQAVERVLVLHQGRILFDGSPNGAVKDSAVIDAYLGE